MRARDMRSAAQARIVHVILPCCMLVVGRKAGLGQRSVGG